MVTREHLSRWAEENDTEIVFYEPPETFDDAIIGLVRRFNDFFVLYDGDKVIANLTTEMGDVEVYFDENPEEAAREHFDFNVIGSWVGDATPAFLFKVEEAS